MSFVSSFGFCSFSALYRFLLRLKFLSRCGTDFFGILRLRLKQTSGGVRLHGEGDTLDRENILKLGHTYIPMSHFVDLSFIVILHTHKMF